MIKSFLTQVLPHLTLIGVTLKKPLYLMAIVPTVAVTTLVVDFYGMAWILFFFFVGDFSKWKYGGHCFNAIMSEVEIKEFLKRR